MTLDQLRILHAIAEFGGVSAAARALNKTQPAISNAVSRLEKEFGVALLDRSAYRSGLSEAGRALHARSKLLLKQAEEIADSAAYLASGHEPHLTISIEALAPVSLISTALSAMASLYPGTEFTLTSDVMGGAVEKLLDGEIDLAVGPQIGGPRGLETKRMTVAVLTGVASPDLLNAGPVSAGEIEALSGVPQIILRETTAQDSGRRFSILEGGRQMIAPDLGVKKQLLLDAAGWGFMPEHLIRRELEDGALVRLTDLPVPERHIDIFAFRNPARPSGPVATAVWDALARSS